MFIVSAFSGPVSIVAEKAGEAYKMMADREKTEINRFMRGLLLIIIERLGIYTTDWN